jgi:hypothetical protein
MSYERREGASLIPTYRERTKGCSETPRDNLACKEAIIFQYATLMEHQGAPTYFIDIPAKSHQASGRRGAVSGLCLSYPL